MNKLDFQIINDALDPAHLVPMWLPNGKKSGKNWMAANPTRNDRTAGSFSVCLLTGRWADFAYGEGKHEHKGGDLISLYAYLFTGNDQGAAARELAQNHGIVLDANTRQRHAEAPRKIEKLAQPEMILPVPAAAPVPTFEHWEFGQPSRTWAYRNAQGDVLLYVCRFDQDDGEKQTLPHSYCSHPNGKPTRWTWKGYTGSTKRPLYGLEVLALMPDAPVLVVEGEKTADAARQLVGDTHAVVTWMGGTGSAEKADLAPLAGRQVILWPDFDAQRYKEGHPLAGEIMPQHEQPGMKAMLAHAAQLKGSAASVLMVGYEHGKFAPGWDLADADTWTPADVRRYIEGHAGDPVAVAAGALLPKPAAAPVAHLPFCAIVNPFGFPDRSEKQQPLNTVENLEYLMAQYGITARYNVIKKSVELALPGADYTADNRANNGLAELASICARNRMPKADLQDYVKLLADRNAYNPVCDWIGSKPWDGTTRLGELFATVQSPMNVKLKNTLILRWMISAVAAAFVPHGFKSRGVLVFTGRQGVGKTAWIKSLVPEMMGLVLEGATLDPANKDTVTNAIGHWLVELGELDGTFRKADIARLKSFITQSADKLRRPYDRIESEYQRRTVFFASVNESQYLVDDTGNSRWWTVPVTAINYSHALDVQQIWAEVYFKFKQGAQWWLTADEEEQLQQLNQEHENTDPIEEKILRAFDWSGEGRSLDMMTATEVLLAVGIDNPNKSQATHASKILKRLTGSEPERKKNGRFFNMPRRIFGRRAVDNEDERPFL